MGTGARRLAAHERLLLAFGVATAVELTFWLRMVPVHTLIPTAFLAVSGVLLARASVTLRVGALSLVAVATQTAAATLAPPEAALVAAIAGVPRAVARRRQTRVPHFLGSVFWTSTGAVATAIALRLHVPGLLAAAAGVAVCSLLNIVVTAVISSAADHARLAQMLSEATRREVIVPYASFALTAILISTFDLESLLGLAQAAGVMVLSLALTSRVSSDLWREAAARQIDDLDRRAAFMVEVEATLHRAKNHAAVLLALLEDLVRYTGDEYLALGSRLILRGQQLVEALDDAASAGRERLSYSYHRANLLSLTQEGLAIVKPLHPQRAVHLRVEGAAQDFAVIADEGAIRDIVVNLVKNACEYSPPGTPVVVTVRLARRGTRQVVVQSEPPLVSGSLHLMGRARTQSTREGSSGIALLASHSAAHQHFGKLTHDGGVRKPLVFILSLPHPTVGQHLLADDSPGA